MRKQTGKPKQDREWFERKVAELITELEKLPADRQEQLRRELEDGRGARAAGPVRRDSGHG